MNQNSSDLEVARWIAEQKSEQQLISLSVVVPAYNEYRRLPVTLMEMIDYLDAQEISYEIIIVDDGSTDGTMGLVSKFEKIRTQVRLIRLPRNYGKGHAVRLGILNAKGSKVMFADADGASPMGEVARLIDAIHKGSDVAIGSRALGADGTRVKTVWYRKYLGRLFNAVVNLVVLPGIADTQCGFKMFTARAARYLFERQRSDGFSFDVEILYIAKRAGLTIKEIPINWTNVPGSKVNLITDSMRMLRDIFVFKIRHRAVTPENYQTTDGPKPSAEAIP